jgi:hypothetical protein
MTPPRARMTALKKAGTGSKKWVLPGYSKINK